MCCSARPQRCEAAELYYTCSITPSAAPHPRPRAGDKAGMPREQRLRPWRIDRLEPPRPLDTGSECRATEDTAPFSPMALTAHGNGMHVMSCRSTWIDIPQRKAVNGA